jgi:site-specific recombinase XerC
MTPYRKKGGRTYYLSLPLSDGSYLRPTSGTRDRDMAEAMQAMLTKLARRGSRSWDLVDAIAQRRLSVAQVYDYYVSDRLEELRATLSDVDLAPAIDAWELRITKELAAETVRKYSAEVASIFPRGEDEQRLPVMRSVVTRAWLKTKLAAVKGSNTNRRRYGAAWLSVLDDVVEAGLLERNPMRELTLPASNPSKVPHLTHAVVLQLLELIPDGVHRALSALRHGAGVEMQAALATRRRDIVDVDARIVWAHGSKNAHRDRQVRVESTEWALFYKYVRAGGFLPDAELFPVTIKEHRQVEKDALAALKAKGALVPESYTLHACRHSYAVEMMRQGRDPVLIANNLGHANTALVLMLYGKFRPTITDIKRAAARKAK